MKNPLLSLITISCLVVVSLIPTNNIYASHAAGMDLTYTYAGNNTYNFTLRLYRDVCGVLASSTVPLVLKSSCGTQTVTLTSPAPTSINNLCSSYLNQTCCTMGAGGLSCYTEYVYTGSTTLAACSDWVASYAECCRNEAISNLGGPGGLNLYIESRINTSSVSYNNSVTFNANPIIYTCINMPFTYNPISFDPDGDSLVYSLISPKVDSSNTSYWAAGFSATNPLPTSDLTIHPSFGIITATPHASGAYAVAVKVKEYRNGVLIASTTRDLQVVVLANCLGQSAAPIFNPLEISTLNGAVLDTVNNTTRLIVCPNNTISFDFIATSGSLITYTSNSGTPGLLGATLNITGDSTSSINGTFTWNTTGIPEGLYTFYVSVQDQSCPSPNIVSNIYNIYLSSLSTTSSQQYICDGNPTTLQLEAVGLGGGNSIGNYTWSPSAGLSNPNVFNPTATITHPSTYAVTYTSGACQLTSSVSILESPYSIHLPNASYASLCLNNSATLNPNYTPALIPLQFSNQTSTVIPRGVTSIPTSTLIPIEVANIFPNIISTTADLDVFDNININIQQQLVDHLVLTLISPSGQQVILSQNNGGAGNGYINSTFAYPVPNTAIAVGTYNSSVIPANLSLIPQGGASVWSNLIGSQINGTWYLRIVHNGNGQTYNGLLQNVTLSFKNLNPEQYIWTPITGLNDPSIASPVVSSNTASNYQLLAFNAAGCSDTTWVSTVTSIILNVNTTNVQYGLDSTGIIAVTANSGIPPYTYLWSNGDTTSTITGLPMGIYSVTVTDLVNCTASLTDSITQIFMLNMAISTIPANGGNNGSANVAMLNGTPPYSYRWSNGATTSSINNLAPGIYSVSVNDANGATNSANAIVDDNTATSITPNNVILFNIQPNPSNGLFDIKLDAGQLNEKHLDIFNLNGQLVYHADLAAEQVQLSVNLSQQVSGIYLVKLQSNQATSIRRILIK